MINSNKVWEKYKTLILWCTLEKSKDKNLFVVGAPRSGTTLLKALIQGHSKAFGPPGESTGVFQLPNVFRSVGFYEKYTSNIRRKIENSKNILELYSKITEEIKKEDKEKIFVDKNPCPPTSGLRLNYVLSKFPKSKWVHIVGDGRDCYVSALDHPYLEDVTKDVNQFAKYWKKIVIANEKKISTEKILTVRYEKLVLNTKKVVKRVIEHIGLKFENNQVYSDVRKKHNKGVENVHERISEEIDD
jgi:hypothetical protein